MCSPRREARDGSARATHPNGWASVSAPTLIVDVEIDDHLSLDFRKEAGITPENSDEKPLIHAN